MHGKTLVAQSRGRNNASSDCFINDDSVRRLAPGAKNILRLRACVRKEAAVLERPDRNFCNLGHDMKGMHS